MVETLRSKFVVLRPVLDERARRLWAAAEARAIGRGGIARVAEATGMSRGTVRAGLKELESEAATEGVDAMPTGRRRRPGAGPAAGASGSRNWIRTLRQRWSVSLNR